MKLKTIIENTIRVGNLKPKALQIFQNTVFFLFLCFSNTHRLKLGTYDRNDF